MLMVKDNYLFKGRHAERVNQLTASFDKAGNKLFTRNYDVYLLAPIVGFLYNVKADVDKSISLTATIMGSQINTIKDDMLFNYRLIVLLDKENEPDFEERVNKAFRYYGSEKAAEDTLLYESYVRGGIDKIYEKIFGTGIGTTDYLKNLFLFTEEIEERYNSKINKDDFLDLCKLARS